MGYMDLALAQVERGAEDGGQMRRGHTQGGEGIEQLQKGCRARLHWPLFSKHSQPRAPFQTTGPQYFVLAPPISWVSQFSRFTKCPASTTLAGSGVKGKHSVYGMGITACWKWLGSVLGNTDIQLALSQSQMAPQIYMMRSLKTSNFFTPFYRIKIER